MAEFEFAGMTFKGGKMFAILTALSTLGGGAWGAFEFYNDYRNMKAQIEEYVAPDLSGIEQELAVQSETMESLSAKLITTEKLVSSLAEEMDRLQASVDKAETLARKVDGTTAETQRELRDDVYAIEIRVNERLRTIDQDLRTTRKELEEKMQLILDNPLNN